MLDRALGIGVVQRDGGQAQPDAVLSPFAVHLAKGMPLHSRKHSIYGDHHGDLLARSAGDRLRAERRGSGPDDAIARCGVGFCKNALPAKFLKQASVGELLAINEDVVDQLTSNTQLAFKAKGSGGTVGTGTIPLS
ncbi:hypothetical protein ABUE31_04115 [Mesorhizobium sp. ZMM04-5]|uniref:Uncharacterized protein n=1 Tax=Mesorhizobium marinum TaxID=3228790 RepID=A0ABV3QVR9_9HYPH